MNHNNGQQPKSPVMKEVLAGLVESTWTPKANVHHFTDTAQGLQLEVELIVPDSKALGGSQRFFRRIVI